MDDDTVIKYIYKNKMATMLYQVGDTYGDISLQILAEMLPNILQQFNDKPSRNLRGRIGSLFLPLC